MGRVMSSSVLYFLAGLVLLIAGIEIMRRGLLVLSRTRLENIIKRATASSLKGFLWGTAATALVQSSTAVTVLAVGMVNARVLTFNQSLGIVLGANVGTCITVQFLALDLKEIALPLLMVGILLLLPSRSRGAGTAAAGTGLTLLGLGLMAGSLAPFHDSPTLLGTLNAAAASPWQGLAAGTIIAAFLHSSTAVAGMAIILAGEGLLNPLVALHIILGANMGTCATALIASTFSSRAAKRTAMAHLVINLAGVLFILPFLPVCLHLLTILSGETSKIIAHFHTLFNLLSSLMALPFIGILARFLVFLLPDR